MFERYTEKARRVIFFGRYEASQFGSPLIETEYLLLGLLREDKDLADRLLHFPQAIEDIRKEIERNNQGREKIHTSVDLPLSNESKRVLVYAADEADRLGDKHIGTEHLLLGLLREEKFFAARLLNERNVRLSQVREQFRATSSKSSNTDRPLGVTLLAILSFLSALILLSLAAWMSRPELVVQMLPSWLANALSSRAPYVALLALLPGAIGFGLWYMQNWARMIAIAFSILGVLAGGYAMVNIAAFSAFAPRQARTAFFMLVLRMAINASVALYLMRPAVAKAFQEAW